MKRGSETNLKIANYKLAASYSRPDQRRGGSCILVRNTFDVKCPDNLIKPKQFHFEYCITEIIQLKLYVVCIYRIPNVNATIFLQSLDELLYKLTKKSKKNIILCGDWILIY